MIELLSDNAKIIVALSGALLAVLAYFLRKHTALVETLDREAVRKEDLESKHRENTEALETINATVKGIDERLQVLAVVAHRLQMAEKDIQNLRDFKHESCEPAVRYISFLKDERPWQESADRLERIESKMDAYEERSSTRRHAIQNGMQVLTAEINNLKERWQR